jgi:hypothetical protein
VIFFTDRDLGNIFPRILRDAGLTVERHDDHFDQNTTDEVWLPEVGRRGWIAISRNFRIRYQPHERDAVMRAGTSLFLVIGKVPHQELAENFVATIGKVEQFLKSHRPPFIARVYRPSTEQIRKGSRKSGRVELWLSYDDWRREFDNR